MQDIHPFAEGPDGGSGNGRFFGGGDRRLRPYNHQNLQALKCPRCDSFNTKFCYYNNYNLSQPRHFCKSCRRYWTKGGVLRNVPVGGGCRKTKRSKQKNTVAASSADGDRERSSKTAQSSSSESSSLTATVAAEEPAYRINTTSEPTAVYKIPNSDCFNASANFDNPTAVNHQATDGQIFPTGCFGSLMTSPPEMLGFGMTDISTTSYGSDQQEFKIPEMKDDGLADTTDWGIGAGSSDGGGDQGLFDLTAAVDPAYWSQSQWTDNDQQSLDFLP